MLSEWLTPVAAVLDRLGARWALVGAWAALQDRGDPRLTTDLDLLVAPVPGLAEALRADGFEVSEVADPGDAAHLLVARRDDIASILRTGRPLDEAYVARWAKAWDVVERWAEARRSRGRIPGRRQARGFLLWLAPEVSR